MIMLMKIIGTVCMMKSGFKQRNSSMWDQEIGWRDFLKTKQSSFLHMRARSAVLGCFGFGGSW